MDFAVHGDPCPSSPEVLRDGTSPEKSLNYRSLPGLDPQPELGYSCFHSTGE
jgi:hypothetical protein